MRFGSLRRLFNADPLPITQERAEQIVLAEVARLGARWNSVERTDEWPQTFTVWLCSTPSCYAIVDRETGKIVRWVPVRWWERKGSQIDGLEEGYYSSLDGPTLK